MKQFDVDYNLKIISLNRFVEHCKDARYIKREKKNFQIKESGKIKRIFQ